MPSRHAVFVALLAFLSAYGPAAWAADEVFPNRAVKLLVGFAPGGSADTVARTLAPRMSEALKQNVVVDNKPGAGGNIASDFLLKAPADGYTVMLGTIGSLAVNPHLSRLPYNPVTDMAAVSLAVVFSNVLVVNASSPVRTFDDYLRLSRGATTGGGAGVGTSVGAGMGGLSFGSSGIGSSGHLAGEFLNVAAGLSNQHVAYRGGAPAMNDLLGGVLPSIFSSPTDAVQHIQSGKLRALATTGLKRLDAMPQVPTIAESGFPGFEATNWYAFMAPQRTPPEVVQRLNAAIVSALNDPGVVAQLRKLGLDPAPTTAAQAASFVRKESDKWGALVRKAGIKSE
jgi:tripartite-type tricarboxylate transporter receptor subunit TctC